MNWQENGTSSEDAKEILERSIILIQAGGYVPFSLPVREFAAEAHKHGVRVYREQSEQVE